MHTFTTDVSFGSLSRPPYTSNGARTVLSEGSSRLKVETVLGRHQVTDIVAFTPKS